MFDVLRPKKKRNKNYVIVQKKIREMHEICFNTKNINKKMINQLQIHGNENLHADDYTTLIAGLKLVGHER